MASVRRLLTNVTGAAALAAALALPAGLAWAGGTFRLGTNIAPVTFDPIKTTANGDIWVMNNMNAFLVRANHDATGIVPDLAERWEISPDGKTYTFHLRDAKFSDGSPVKASDAAFSLLRVRDDKESAWGFLYSTLDTAVAKDDHTLVLTLKEPTAPLLACSPCSRPRCCPRRWSRNSATASPSIRSAPAPSGSRSGGARKS